MGSMISTMAIRWKAAPSRLMKYATGKYRAYPQYITFVRTRHLEIDAAEDEVINVDGEAEYGKHVVFDLVPGGVNFLFPRNMPFFN